MNEIIEIEIERPALTSYQRDILYNGKRFTIVEASTKVGKTFCLIFWIFERAHADWNEKGYNHWWVAPTYAQARIAFERMKRAIVETGLYEVNETNMRITCPNGAIIHFRSGEVPDNLYGEDVYSIVFDEAPRGRVEAYYAVRSTITRTGGEMKLIGNFGGSANWMHLQKEKSVSDPENYAYFKITAYDAIKEGILTEESVLQAQKDLPPKVFKALYLAEESESPDQLISYDAMQALFTNTHAKAGQRYMSCDIAFHGSDRFVTCVWDGLKLIDLIVIDKCDAEQVEGFIKQTAERHRVMLSNVVYDADGVGIFLRGYLKSAKPFMAGSAPVGKENFKNFKSQCAYKLAGIINSGEIYIDCDVDKKELLSELECLRSHYSEGKLGIIPKDKMKEYLGRSPDLLDAIILRMYFEIKKPAMISVYAN